MLCGVAGEVVLGMSYGTQLRGPREGPTWSLQITSLPWQLCWCSGELAGQWPGRRPSVSVASDGTRSQVQGKWRFLLRPKQEPRSPQKLPGTTARPG